MVCYLIKKYDKITTFSIFLKIVIRINPFAIKKVARIGRTGLLQFPKCWIFFGIDFQIYKTRGNFAIAPANLKQTHENQITPCFHFSTWHLRARERRREGAMGRASEETRERGSGRSVEQLVRNEQAVGFGFHVGLGEQNRVL